jgi:hypothetical protein
MSRLMQSISLFTVVAAGLATPLPSHAADPTTADCLSAHNSAVSLGNEHKLRAARYQLLVCAAGTCPADIRKECMKRVADVNGAIPTIVFEAKDASGKELSAVKVAMDGQTLADRLEGTALSIDPGEHTFTFETAGQPNVETKLMIHEGEKERHERIVFGSREATAASPVASTGPGRQEVAPPPPSVTPAATTVSPETRMRSREVASPQRGSGQRIAGYAVGGAGLLGIGVGTIFMLQRSSKLSDRNNVCPTRQHCTADDQAQLDQLTKDADTAGTIGVVGLVLGGAAVVGGVVLVLTAPSKETIGASVTEVRPWVGLNAAGAAVGGTW